MPEFVDTHAHLTDPKFPVAVQQAVAQSATAGITQIVCPSVDLPSSQAAVRLAAQFPTQVFAAIGVHPQYAGASMSEFAQLATQPGVVAIGEVGLDYYRQTREAVGESQRRAFSAFLDLATERSLPVIVHGRNAYDDILAVTQDFPSVRIVLHSFEADAAIAKQALDRGWCISLTALITYPDYGWLREVVAQLPLDRLMVETDAPYLPPAQPSDTVRPSGLTNLPTGVITVTERLAAIKQLPLDEVAAATTTTARQFFALPEPA